MDIEKQDSNSEASDGGCNAKESTCHVAGVVFIVAACVCLVAGFVLISVFVVSSAWYVVGIICVVIGSILTVLSMVYVCVSLRQQWLLFGCVTIKAPPRRHSQGPPAIGVVTEELPTKDPLHREGGNMAGKSNGAYRPSSTYSAYSDKGKSDVDWDPDTILAD